MLESLTPIAATGLFEYAWVIIAVPAVVAVLLLVLGRITNSFGHWLASAAPLVSLGLAITLFVQMMGASPESRAIGQTLYTWINAGTWKISFGLLIDPLSILFVLLITGVGAIIHIYSISYMADDPNKRRFFAYLNLFIAAMLLLVMADNYLVLFIGWEGVGLASYLLISFWQERPSAAAAGKKAFIMNRVGDLGLLIAMFTMLAMFGSVSFSSVNESASQLSLGWATFIGFMLLLAACGKSAQVPLQDWLLDAMEGPTPVSALIHAATMVTAGVYLVVRSGAIFEQSPSARLAVAIVGTVTILVGAWIGCAKDDIKKVLAGSTMSQIGYMILAAGIGPIGYAFAIFHLLTHGFFKANLFLGAGSVMHSLKGEVNMRRFGALRQLMPITTISMAIGYLAIIGFPFLSGFYSKDHIIEAAFKAQPALGVLAIIGAGGTAFYMTRLMIMTFTGQPRYASKLRPGESPILMWVPLLLLAAGSIAAGMVLNGWIVDWLTPIGAIGDSGSWLPDFTIIGIITLVVVALGVTVAWLIFGRKPVPEEAPEKVSIFTKIGRRDLYGTAINDTLVVRPVGLLAKGVALMDTKVINPATEGTGWLVKTLGDKVRILQNGQIRTYSLILVISLLLIGLALILSRWM